MQCFAGVGYLMCLIKRITDSCIPALETTAILTRFWRMPGWQPLSLQRARVRFEGLMCQQDSNHINQPDLSMLKA